MKRSRLAAMRIRLKRYENRGQQKNSESTTPLQYNVGSVKVEGIELTDQGDNWYVKQSDAKDALDWARRTRPGAVIPMDKNQVPKYLWTSKPLNKGLPTDDASRKRLQMWTFLMEYFPDAFLAIVEVSVAGNEQHNPGQPLHWAREKSTDQLNTAFRHMWDWGRGVKRDTDGQYHLAKAAWRLMAQLQLDIENDAQTLQGSQDDAK